MPHVELTLMFHGLVREVSSRPQLETEAVVRLDKTRILACKKVKKLDVFEVQAEAILSSISGLKDFLEAHKSSYVNVLGGGGRSRMSSMSDLERDRIEAGADEFVRKTKQLIETFKNDLRTSRLTSGQRTKHLEAVSDLLEVKLREACGIYSRQKAVRVAKDLEAQKLGRLEIEARMATSKSEDAPPVQQQLIVKSEEAKGQKYYDWSEDEEEDELSPEEIQMLEMENDKMYNDLVSLEDNVQQIETKVVKIAQLQEIFTEKVLEQKADIFNVASNAVASTENLKDGNEELRKAIQRNASIRVYILFFLLVMSFSLLFLDWYND